MEEKNKNEIIMPITIYEMLQDRFEAEKDKMRKQYKSIISWLCVVFFTTIIILISISVYILSNYNFAYYNQDGDGINNINGDYSTQGGMTNESDTSNNAAQTAKAKGNSH